MAGWTLPHTPVSCVLYVLYRGVLTSIYRCSMLAPFSFFYTYDLFCSSTHVSYVSYVSYRGVLTSIYQYDQLKRLGSKLEPLSSLLPSLTYSFTVLSILSMLHHP